MRDYKQNRQGNANRICEHGHMNNVVLSEIINERELNGYSWCNWWREAEVMDGNWAAQEQMVDPAIESLNQYW